MYYNRYVDSSIINFIGDIIIHINLLKVTNKLAELLLKINSVKAYILYVSKYHISFRLHRLFLI